MVDRLTERLSPLRHAIGGLVDVSALERGLAAAREAISGGVIGYALFAAELERDPGTGR
jgi:hypothetical protein